MDAKQIKWFPVAENEAAIPWQPNNMCQVAVDGKTITLARHKGVVFAFAQKCPHASGILANGYLNAAGQVVCPEHSYHFSIQNGRNTTGEGYYLKTYPVESRADGIYVGIF